jgi:glycosyltransferase involved in cell wall biosynthesis
MVTEISAVICVKNGEKTIEKALHSLKKAGINEIIVIDGGSEDDTLVIAERFTRTIYDDEGKGLGHARQLGAEKATGTYVLFLDSDAELSAPDTVRQMLVDVEQFHVSGVQAQLIDPRENKTYWEEAEDFHRRIRYNRPGEYIHADTIISLIPRDLILQYTFDDYFRDVGVEDADFFYRAIKNGHTFAVSNATGYHYHRSSRVGFIRQRVWYGRGAARLLAKNKTIAPFFSPFLVLGYGMLISVYYGKMKYIPFYVLWMASGVYGCLKGIKELVMEPGYVQRARRL